MRRLELLAALDASRNIEDDRTQGDPHGHFHEPDVVNGAGQGENLGSLALFGPQAAVPGAPFEDDLGDVGERFHVIQHGGLAPQSGLDRTGRLDAGHTPLAFQGIHQSGRLAADESPGSGVDPDVEIESGSEDVFAENPQFFRPFNSQVQTFDRQGVFRPDIEVPLVGIDCLGADGHAFQHGMRIRFQHAPVHKRPGVAFVAVADDILGEPFVFSPFLPFFGGGEPGPAAAPQPGEPNFFNNLLGGHLGEDLIEGFVSVLGDIILDIFRIDGSPVPQHPGNLQFEEGYFPESEFLHDLSLEKMLLNNLPGFFRSEINILDRGQA